MLKPGVNPSLHENCCTPSDFTAGPTTPGIWPQPGGSGTPSNITYGFINYTPDLPVSVQRRIVEDALARWAAAAPLHFTETIDSGAAYNSILALSPDIRILFAAGDHGDSSPFDGTGGTLAHGFYPPVNGVSAAGDVHFDEDETWTDGPGPGVFDMNEVATHEFGHAIGIGHEPSIPAIMNPTYKGIFTSGVSLFADDIAGVQDLYGAGTGSVTPFSDAIPFPADTDDDFQITIGEAVTYWIAYLQNTPTATDPPGLHGSSDIIPIEWATQAVGLYLQNDSEYHFNGSFSAPPVIDDWTTGPLPPTTVPPEPTTTAPPGTTVPPMTTPPGTTAPPTTTSPPTTAPPPPPSPEMVELQAVKDNTLYESGTGSLSNGLGSYFFAGRTNGGDIRRGLLVFDIAGNIPAGSTIMDVFLTLHMSRTVAPNQTVNLHRVLADWGEGTSNAGGQEGGGAASTTGDATWIHKFFNTVSWMVPGGDFMGTISASKSVGGIADYTWGSTAQLVTDVQGMLDNPSGNFGWIVRGNEASIQTSKRFDSLQNGSPSLRPELTVTYLPPP